METRTETIMNATIALLSHNFRLLIGILLKNVKG